MKNIFSAGLIAASALLFTTAAHASLGEHYSNETDFLNDTGAQVYSVGTVSHNTSSTLPSSYTVGPVTFVNADGAGGLLVNNDDYGNSVTYLFNGSSNPEITQASGQSIGFLLGSDGTAETIDVTLDGVYDVGDIELPDSTSTVFWGYHTFDFFGPITSVTFSNPNSNIDVLHFDTDATNIAATPEPSSFALLGTGILGVGGMVRRRFLRG